MNELRLLLMPCSQARLHKIHELHDAPTHLHDNNNSTNIMVDSVFNDNEKENDYSDVRAQVELSGMGLSDITG